MAQAEYDVKSVFGTPALLGDLNITLNGVELPR